MNIKQFVVNPFGVNGFVLSNDAGDAILIDPSVSSEQEEAELANYIATNNLTVRHLLNTHLHLDHVLGNAFVARKYGVQPEAHEEDAFLLDLQEEQSQMFGLPMREHSPGLGNYLAEGDAVDQVASFPHRRALPRRHRVLLRKPGRSERAERCSSPAVPGRYHVCG